MNFSLQFVASPFLIFPDFLSPLLSASKSCSRFYIFIILFFFSIFTKLKYSYSFEVIFLEYFLDPFESFEALEYFESFEAFKPFESYIFELLIFPRAYSLKCFKLFSCKICYLWLMFRNCKYSSTIKCINEVESSAMHLLFGLMSKMDSVVWHFFWQDFLPLIDV